MDSIGVTIRRERLRRGLDLEQVSRTTKISSRLLEAIESEQFDRLPGGVFTRSFVHQYARALGIDEEEIDSELHRILNPGPPQTPPLRNAPPPVRAPAAGRSWPVRHSWTSLCLIAGSLVLISAVYIFRQRERIPERQTEPQAAAPAQPPAEMPAAPPSTVLLEMAATAESSISVSSAGNQLFAGTLEAGDHKSLPAQDPVEIRLGDAAAVSVRWNGKSLGPIGPKGELRVIQISGDTVRIEAPKPAPAPLIDLY